MADLPKTEADIARITDLVTARRALQRCLGRISALEGELAELRDQAQALRAELGDSAKRRESALAERVRALERDNDFRTQGLRRREEELRELDGELRRKEAGLKEREAAAAALAAGCEARSRELEAEYAAKRERMEEAKEQMRRELASTVRGLRR